MEKIECKLNIEDLCVVLDINEIEDFIDTNTDLGAREAEHKKAELNLNWKVADTESVDYDLEEGWAREQIVVVHLPTNTHFETYIYFEVDDGYYTKHNDNLTWVEVEPIETTVTKWLPKTDG